MSRSTRSIPRSSGRPPGFSTLELLIAIAITTVVMAATMGFFHATARFMRNQAYELETTQAARSTLDVMVRDLRLGGACLPVTGSFITLDGKNTGTQDEIITRTGLTRPDLSCVRSATSGDTMAAGGVVAVENADGFLVGRAYIHHPDGGGEFFNITGVNVAAKVLGRDRSFSRDYPVTSGVYAIDERHFFIQESEFPWGTVPELMMQIGDKTPTSFAVGIETLDISYVLRRNCPPCDQVPLPDDDDEWRLVDQILLTVAARSERRNLNGHYYRRTLSVAVKPRNLLPN